MPDHHFIDAASPPAPALVGHLRLGPPDGPRGRIEADSCSLLRDGRRWLPVMGEMHYSRVPASRWGDGLRAMRAGGVDIAASYVFWNHHEEIEGRWRWDGGRDLRRFIQTAAEAGLLFVLRIGPWVHGEAREGGFPDWLKQVCQERTPDPAYLARVAILYREIARQCQGLLWRDGGPIIGVQIENEFMHCGGEGGGQHLLELKRLAIAAGFAVPFYTVTGWGGAPVPEDEFIPVSGGYPDAPWAGGCEALPPPEGYTYRIGRDERATTIGSDLAGTAAIDGTRWSPKRYPMLTAEMGAGNQLKHHRRPTIHPADGSALIQVRLGEGGNLIGYYMFHGGTQPLGERSSLEEPGYPVRSYDFQAPIGEDGRLRPVYHRLRPVHFLLSAFGDRIAGCTPRLPAGPPITPSDGAAVRACVRSDGRRGWLFLNRHQRGIHLEDQVGVQVSVRFADQTITVPSRPCTLRSGSHPIWPLRFDLDGLELVWATAMPVAHLADGTWVFIASPGVECECAVEEQVLVHGPIDVRGQDGLRIISVPIPGMTAQIVFTGTDGRERRMMVLSASDAARMWLLPSTGIGRLVLTDAEIQAGRAGWELLTARDGEHQVHAWNDGGWRTHRAEAHPGKALAAAQPCPVPVTARSYPFADPEAQAWTITVATDTACDDLRLAIRYVGDSARLYLDGCLVADDFWYQEVWSVSLTRLDGWRPGISLVLVITPWRPERQVYVEHRPYRPGTQLLEVELQSIRRIPIPGMEA